MSGSVFERFLRVAPRVAAASAAVLAICAGISMAHGAPIAVSRMSDDISISSAPEGAKLSTMGGDIHLGSAGGSSALSTMGGDISVGTMTASLSASTMGGDIEVGSSTGALALSTKGGDIKVGGTTASVSASTLGGDVQAILQSGKEERSLKLSSLGGDVTVHVPADFDGTIEARLSFTRNAHETYKIEQPFGLASTVSPEWEEGFGTPRKTIEVKGAVGSGRDHLVLSTTNGFIRIIKD